MIQIDKTRDSLFDELGLLRLRDGYMRDNEESPQERFAYVAEQFGSNAAHSQRLYNYFSKHWWSNSTPILSFGRTKGGMPISCYLNYLDDSSDGLVDTLSETNWLSMKGGGVGIHFGIRSSDDKSVGVVPHAKVYESASYAFKQGSCYAPGTEILTDSGWKLIENLSLQDTIACSTDRGYLEWHKPTELVDEQYSGNMIRFYNENRGIDFSVTEDHSMVIERKGRSNKTKGWKGELLKIRASEVPQHNEARFVLAPVNPSPERVELSPFEQLLIAFQADGHLHKNDTTEFHFSKDRKIDRLIEILKKTTYSYTVKSKSDGTTSIFVSNFYGDKDFSWVDLTAITPNKANAMVEEVAEWDGSRGREFSITYSNTSKSAADTVHALAVIAGRASRLSYMDMDSSRQRLYTVYISRNPHFNLEKLRKIYYEYTGKVYCCVVPTGRIIVRNNGVSLICGNTRRGSFAIYLDISHPDIVQFIELRKPTGDPSLRAPNINHGVNIPDEFYRLVEESMKDADFDDSWPLIQPNTGEVKEIVSARALWALLVKTRHNTGEPYIWNIDTANNALPQYQKDLGLRNNGSNLCVAPETTILTDRGHIAIEDLEDQKVRVWNGKQFSEVTVIKTGVNQPVLTVNTNAGYSLDCTPYHKFYVKNEYHKPAKEVMAAELKQGDKLVKFICPIIQGDEKLDLAYQNGFFSADGCYDKVRGTNIVYLYNEKRKLLDLFLPHAKTHTVNENEQRETLTIPLLQQKFFVPDAQYSIESRISWLAGYLDGDGTIAKAGKSQTLQIASINYQFITNVQLMLQTLGVSSKVTLVREAAKKLMPKNDGTGELGLYNCKELHRLLISGSGVVTLLELGLKCHRLEISNHIPNRNAERFVTIESITDYGRTCDTYCFNEPLEHKGVFNGILTGNCTEISLVTSPERTAVCCLGSINAEYYDDWKDDKQFIPDCAEMLDNVLTYFIENAPEELNRAKFSAYRERSIGVGLLGFHAYLQKNNIAFESALATSFNIRVHKHIREQLDQKNGELACERGACPDAAEANVHKRFSHVMALAPNATSSIIMGNTSPSCEPYAANIYLQDTLSGAHVNINKFLKKILEEQAAKESDPDWYKDTIASIVANDGSVAHLDWMDDYIKKVFVTAREVDQHWIIEHAIDRQPYYDQAQSINIYTKPNISVKELHELHFRAWKGGLKSLYYCRSSKLRKADKVGQSIERVRIEEEHNFESPDTVEDTSYTGIQGLLDNTTCLACE